MSVSFSGQLFPNTQSLLIPGPITVTKNQNLLMGMAWVRLTKTPTQVGDDINFILYSTGTSGGDEVRYKFKMRLAGPSMSLDLGGVSPDGGPLIFADSIANALTVGPWYHIAGALDYAANRGFFYVNGDLFDTQNMTGGTFTAPTSNTDGIRGRLGSILDGDSEPMAGLMEDVRLYNFHSAAMVKTIYTAKGKDGIQAGLLHRFQMRDLPSGNVSNVANVAQTERIDASASRNPTWSADTITAFTRQGRMKRPIGR